MPSDKWLFGVAMFWFAYSAYRLSDGRGFSENWSMMFPLLTGIVFLYLAYRRPRGATK
ncbi:hypothetical protein [Sphingopyxis sp. EG6]|uniref:hypothetical protein n=1 Tax=Sphingopyxis sp. EG6 TaxID=1874061 RepID=UPI0015594385|nr:hypothetical protein [Sphingopyxis sp. EG6]